MSPLRKVSRPSNPPELGQSSSADRATGKLGQTIEQTEREISTTEKTKSFEAAVLAEQEREKQEAGAKFNKILETYDERSNKLDASIGCMLLLHFYTSRCFTNKWI